MYESELATTKAEQAQLTASITSPRTLLARHPTAVECARVAATISKSRAEIVVFDNGRAFVVASSDMFLLAPRVLLPTETDVLDGRERHSSSEKATSLVISDVDGTAIGALSIFDEVPADLIDAMHSLSRMIEGVLVTANAGDDSSFYRFTLEGLRDAVIILDAELNILWSNRAVGSLLGRTPAELEGRSAADFLHPDDLIPTLDAITRLAEGLEMYRTHVRLKLPSGEFAGVDVTGMDHSGDPLIGGMVLSLRSADAESEAELSRERTQRMSEAIVGELRDGIVATDEFGSVTTANAAARKFFDIDLNKPASQIKLEDLSPVRLDGRILELNVSQEPPEANDVFLVAGPDAIRYLTISRQDVGDADAHAHGSVFVFHDVTEARRSASELREQALHDQLTGLANRRQLEARMAELASQEPVLLVAACFVDLDNFKLINDNNGHRRGDDVIRIAAERLTAKLRPSDLLVRQGGDEFVVLLNGVSNIEEAEAIAEGFRSSLSDPFHVENERYDLTASIGVAVTDSNDLGELLLQHADLALYAAKRRGRNCVAAFDSTLAEAVGSEAEQRKILRSAIDDGRVVMHFQPLIDAATGRSCGYEALARVRTVTGDIIGPAAFLESIAHTSLMWDLDITAFQQSCTAANLLSSIDSSEPPFVACNFSAVSLARTEFVTFVDDTAKAAGLQPHQIRIEITESAAFEVGSAAVPALLQLHDLGYRLSLDDFGTGYSSLAHLRDLPISSVKVDKSFIAQLTHNTSERAIAEAVVLLAKQLGLSVVAEGVENADMVDQAKELGFSTLQGWHYAAALPLADCLADWSETNQASDSTS